MNEEKTNIGGYPGSQLYEYINNELYEYLPQDLKDNIIETKVLSGHEYGKSTNHVTYDKLYLLSPVELYGESFTENADRGIETSRQLDYYDLKETSLENWGATHKKYNSSEFGTNVYWLRSAVFYPNSTDNSGFYVNNGSEYWSYNRFTSQNVIGVAPAFRIG